MLFDKAPLRRAVRSIPRGLAAGALLLIAATAARADDGYVVGDWRGAVWQGELAPSDTLELDLIRATVFVEPSNNGVAGVRIVAQGEPGAAKLDVTSAEHVVRVRDVYPKRPWFGGNRPGECPPPGSDRGDFASDGSTFIAVVKVPAGRRLRVRVMDGDIHVGRISAPLDLRTNRGTVHRDGRRAVEPSPSR